MRLNLTRNFYYPANAIEIKDPDSSAVAYLGASKTGSGKVVAVGFSGKRNKPDFNYSFRDETAARKHIAEHAERIRASQAVKAKWKAEKGQPCRTAAEVYAKAAREGWISCPDTAVCLRAALAREFPGIRFSVTSDRCLRVGWIDGPNPKAVEAIANDYSGEGFDGMIDMRYSIKRWLSADGSMSLAHDTGTEGSRGSAPEFIGSAHKPDAVLTSVGADFVFCNRTISQPVKMALARKVCSRYGVTMPDSFEPEHGFERFLNTTLVQGDYLCQLIYRASTGALEV